MMCICLSLSLNKSGWNRRSSFGCYALATLQCTHDPGQRVKHDVIHETGSTYITITMPSEEDGASAIGNTHKTFGKVRPCGFRDMLVDIRSGILTAVFRTPPLEAKYKQPVGLIIASMQ